MQYLLLKEGIPKGRILEVGAGFGRISKLILERFHENIDEYVLLDISKDQLQNARMYLEKNLGAAILEKVDVKYIQCNFMDFVNLENKFDLVLAVEVLMHVLPKDIQKAIDALISVSQKNVLTIDWYEHKKPEKEIAAHNFIHDYPTLYINNPLVEHFKRIPIRDENENNKKESTEAEQQSIFHVIKKKEKVFGWLIR